MIIEGKLPCCKYVNMAILRQRNPIDKFLGFLEGLDDELAAGVVLEVVGLEHLGVEEGLDEKKY